MLSLLVASAVAQAQGALDEGLSVDTQLLRPTLGAEPIAGIVRLPGASEGLLPGLLLSADLDPVTLSASSGSREPVVTNRFYAAPSLGFEHGRFRAVASIPVARQFAGATLYAPDDGIAWGNPQLAITLTAMDRPVWKLGVHGRVYAPLGTPDAYLAEMGTRTALSGVLERHGQALSLSVELGALHRAQTPTLANYSAGNELQIRAGGSVPLSSGLDVVWAVHRSSVPSTTGFEEHSTEALLGLRGSAGSLGMGRGLSRGLGTTRARMWLLLPGTASLKQMGVGRPKPSELPASPKVPSDAPVQNRHLVPEQGPPQQLVDLAGAEEPKVSSNGLAQVVDDEIRISEPILFVQGTARILPESQPVLDAVAELMAQHPELAHVTVVGHASVEGSHESNYALSTERAQSIYEALVLAGVHPHRLSFRGMGEVEPLQGQQESRRVVFQIVHQLHPLDLSPEYPDHTPLPWSGEPVPVVQPPRPVLEPEPEPEPDFTLDEDDFELEVAP